MLPLALIYTLTFSQSAGLAAQAQPPRGLTGNVLQANGVISGTVASSSGRSLSGITMELVDAKGTVVGKTVSSRDGDFTFQAVGYDTYTLQCVDDNKVIGTSSVTLQQATESVRITGTSDAVDWWKKTGVLTGLAAAAAALGATAIVTTTGDASGSR
jgi:hypothetical protein